MRIGIFAPLIGRQAAGPETYECNLIRSIAALNSTDPIELFLCSKKAPQALGVDQPNVRQHILWPRTPWINIPVSFPLTLMRHRVDLYHATIVPPPFSPVDYVFTMLDVTPFVHPEFYRRSARLPLARLIARGLRNAKMIICISQHTLDATAELFGVPREKMVVTHLGVDERFSPSPDGEARQRVERDWGLRGRYILYLGKIQHSKNVVRLVEAFHRFHHETADDVKLVLAGRRNNPMPELDQTIERLGLSNHVVELGYVPDETIPSLYRAAECLAFPTLWEGFGLPVLEAMACGTPVITSNVACLPEVAGEAAILVDPRSTDQITEAMQRLFTDGALRRSMIDKGLRQAACFTWRRTAEQTLKVYQQAAAM